MDDVARHYDALDEAYRRVWGPHLHHGLWRTGHETRAHATRALLDHALARAELPPSGRGSGLAPRVIDPRRHRPPLRIVDVGCGYGASAGVLAREHGARVTGFTLSAAQAARAPEDVEVRVQDWLANDLPDWEADLVLALESLSHMPDLGRALAEAARVLRPGGRLVLVDWMRGDRPRAWEQRLLVGPIEREGRLPALNNLAHYETLARTAGLDVLGTEDLSAATRRTWPLARRRLLRLLLEDPRLARTLLSAANPERTFAFSLYRIPLALRTGAMRLVLLWAEKPRSPGGSAASAKV